MTKPSYAFYIAGMDMNVDLIRCAVSCLQERAKLDCKIYVGVEAYDKEFEGATLLKTEPGKQWTGRVREHLKQIDEDYLVMILEDYFIERVDEAALLDLCGKMESHKAGVIKLHAVPRPDYGLAGQANLGLFNRGKKMGRTNTQPALWKKTFLQELLFEDESLWEFEVNGAVRSSALPYNVLGVYSHIIHYDEVVKKGKFRNRYQDKYADLLAREGIVEGRGLLDKNEELKFEIAHHFSRFLQKLLSQHQRTVLRKILGL